MVKEALIIKKQEESEKTDWNTVENKYCIYNVIKTRMYCEILAEKLRQTNQRKPGHKRGV